MDDNVCRKNLEAGSVNVGDWCGVESLSFIVVSMYLVPSNSSFAPFQQRVGLVAPSISCEPDLG